MTERSSVRGEYDATMKYAANKNLKFGLTFEEFQDYAAELCKFCGGKTPNYECNSLNVIIVKRGFQKGNIYAVCWPCKNLMGNGKGAERNLDHVHRIVAHQAKKPFDLKEAGK